MTIDIIEWLNSSSQFEPQTHNALLACGFHKLWISLKKFSLTLYSLTLYNISKGIRLKLLATARRKHSLRCLTLGRLDGASNKTQKHDLDKLVEFNLLIVKWPEWLAERRRSMDIWTMATLGVQIHRIKRGEFRQSLGSKSFASRDSLEGYWFE